MMFKLPILATFFKVLNLLFDAETNDSFRIYVDLGFRQTAGPSGDLPHVSKTVYVSYEADPYRNRLKWDLQCACSVPGLPAQDNRPPLRPPQPYHGLDLSDIHRNTDERTAALHFDRQMDALTAGPADRQDIHG
jgi:hypothetical protein